MQTLYSNFHRTLKKGLKKNLGSMTEPRTELRSATRWKQKKNILFLIILKLEI